MCVTDKCCFIVPLNVGCIIIGIGTLVTSICWTVTAAVLLMQEINYQKEVSQAIQTHILRLTLNNGSINFMLGVALLLGILWILLSLILIFGVEKNKPNLVLTYFGFGTMMTLLGQLSGLLLLINNLWWIAMVVFIIFCIHTHFLVVVHSVYDQMLKGQQFGFSRHIPLDEAPIMEDF